MTGQQGARIHSKATFFKELRPHLRQHSWTPRVCKVWGEALCASRVRARRPRDARPVSLWACSRACASHRARPGLPARGKACGTKTGH